MRTRCRRIFPSRVLGGTHGSILSAFLVLLSACSGGQSREHIPTGLAVTESPDGSVVFVATARASENAIAKGSVAMKRTTCLEGVRLQITHALRERRFSENKFRDDGVVFLRESEYCRRSGTYFPAGIPESKGTRSGKESKDAPR